MYASSQFVTGLYETCSFGGAELALDVRLRDRAATAMAAYAETATPAWRRLRRPHRPRHIRRLQPPNHAEEQRAERGSMRLSASSDAHRRCTRGNEASKGIWGP